MSWYYLEEGRQVGPISEADIAALASQGRLNSASLIWREGLADWQSYAFLQSRGGLPSPAIMIPAATGAAPAGTDPAAPTLSHGEPPPLPPPMASCSQCGRYYLTDDMLTFEEQPVCVNCKQYFFQRLKEGVCQIARAFEPPSHFAGFWIRSLAMTMDLGIVFVLCMLMKLFLEAMGERDAALVQAIFLDFLLGILLYVILVGRFGGTVGKLVLGMKIVQSDGRKVGYGLAMGRFFTLFLSVMLMGVGFLIVMFDKEKRALHDYICDTRVSHR